MMIMIMIMMMMRMMVMVAVMIDTLYIEVASSRMFLQIIGTDLTCNTYRGGGGQS